MLLVVCNRKVMTPQSVLFHTVWTEEKVRNNASFLTVPDASKTSSEL